mmetsp:Transcript_42440/g.81106  ORF Transcript_42440/g.81106 Transcript_42440/m.81106 type:complete len:408 (-) Transcript_42440:1009-2232(-)
MAPRKTLWTHEEDDKLRLLVGRHGSKNWTRIASLLPSKVGKQCRRRWQNHLNATLKTHVWTAEEDKTLLEGHRVLGNKWTEISRMVTGRTDNAVKNRYMALTKKGIPEDGDALSDDRLHNSSSSSLTLTSDGEEESLRDLCSSPSPRMPRSVRVPVAAAPPSLPTNSPRSQQSTPKRAAFRVVRPAFSRASSQDLKASASVEAMICKVEQSRAGPARRLYGDSDDTEMTALDEAGREEYVRAWSATAPAANKQVDVPVAAHPVAESQEAGATATENVAGENDSPGLPTFQEASLLKNFADATRPPTMDELRHEFEELLVQASCLDSGSTFVEFVLNTAKSALASCRGEAPLMDVYMNSLASICQMAHLGSIRYDDAGIPRLSSPPPTPPLSGNVTVSACTVLPCQSS